MDFNFVTTFVTTLYVYFSTMTMGWVQNTKKMAISNLFLRKSRKS